MQRMDGRLKPPGRSETTVPVFWLFQDPQKKYVPVLRQTGKNVCGIIWTAAVGSAPHILWGIHDNTVQFPLYGKRRSRSRSNMEILAGLYPSFSRISQTRNRPLQEILNSSIQPFQIFGISFPLKNQRADHIPNLFPARPDCGIQLLLPDQKEGHSYC